MSWGLSERSVPRILTEELRSLGFRRLRENKFERDMGDVLHRAFITRSRFGPIWFIEIGVVHPGVRGPEDAKKLTTWHMRTRPSRFVDVRPYNRALAAESGLADTVRETLIEAALETVEREFFDRLSSVEDVERFAIGPSDPDRPIWVILSDWVRGKRSQDDQGKPFHPDE